MSIETARKKTYTLLTNALPTIQIEYMNTRFEPPTNESWARIFFIEEESVRRDISPTPRITYNGAINISIISPINTGMKPHNVLSETVINTFSQKDFILSDGDKILYHTTRIRWKGIEDNYLSSTIFLLYRRETIAI